MLFMRELVVDSGIHFVFLKEPDSQQLVVDFLIDLIAVWSELDCWFAWT